jgi:hypothetical protein
MLQFKFLLIASCLFVLNGCHDKNTRKESPTETISYDSGQKGSLTINGQIDSFPYEEARFNINGMMLTQSENSGRVQSNGKFTLTLPKSFSNTTDELMSEFNDATGFFMSRQTMMEYLMVEPNNELDLKNENKKISLAGSSYGFQLLGQSADTLGMLYPVSSEAYLKSMMSPQQDPSVQGFHVAFVHVRDTIIVQGSFKTPNYIGNEAYDIKHKYDISLLPGWNILQHSVDTLKSNGITAPKTLMVKSLTRLPEQTEWILYNRK